MDKRTRPHLDASQLALFLAMCAVLTIAGCVLLQGIAAGRPPGAPAAGAPAGQMGQTGQTGQTGQGETWQPESIRPRAVCDNAGRHRPVRRSPAQARARQSACHAPSVSSTSLAAWVAAAPRPGS